MSNIEQEMMKAEGCWDAGFPVFEMPPALLVVLYLGGRSCIVVVPVFMMGYEISDGDVHSAGLFIFPDCELHVFAVTITICGAAQASGTLELRQLLCVGFLPRHIMGYDESFLIFLTYIR